MDVKRKGVGFEDATLKKKIGKERGGIINWLGIVQRYKQSSLGIKNKEIRKCFLLLCA